MIPRGNIKVTLEGRGQLTLRDADYVASGGEGSIYRANDTVVKLYSDKDKMTRDGMGEKLRGIEINIVAAKRRAKAFPSNEADAEIEKLKMAAGRIRAHLRRGVYG